MEIIVSFLLGLVIGLLAGWGVGRDRAADAADIWMHGRECLVARAAHYLNMWEREREQLEASIRHLKACAACGSELPAPPPKLCPECERSSVGTVVTP